MIREVLISGWTLRRAGQNEKYEINVMPKMVHTVLVENGIIDKPWRPGGTIECKWVGESEWVYETRFDADEEHGYIWFGGLYVIADVYLNGVLLGHSANIYSPVKFNAEFRKTDNRLKVVFRPGIRTDGQRRTDAVYRTGRHDFDNYLGNNPFFCRVGIFRDVMVCFPGIGEIEHFGAVTVTDPSLALGSVNIIASGMAKDDAVIKVCLENDGEIIEKTFDADMEDGKWEISETISVNSPKLWEPSGRGKQDLYSLTLTLETCGEEADKKEKTVGFRHVTMSRPLHFVVNGSPIRLYGGGLAPIDQMTPVWNEKRTKKILRLAIQGNMNAVRVWGESEPFPDEFYDICDRMGLLVWQDFHSLPLAPHRRDICEKEVGETVERLMSHPCIVIWCGGNEDRMWHDFYNREVPYPYTETLERVIPAAVHRLDKTRPYIPSSPYFGNDANDPREWDTHGYTNMWYVPHYKYVNFASEDTRVTAPGIKSIKQFFFHDDIWPGEFGKCTREKPYPWPESWRKYTGGSAERKTGDVQNYFDPETPEQLVYNLGMSAADYYTDVIERQRRGRSSAGKEKIRKCGGYMFWKINDSWPHFYTGKIDYFLEPYPVYYAVKRAFSPVLISFDTDLFASVWCVNDSNDVVRGTLKVWLFNIAENRILTKKEFRVMLSQDESEMVADLTPFFGTFSRDCVLAGQLEGTDGHIISSNIKRMDIERRLRFHDPELKVKEECGQIIIECRKFARCVKLEGGKDEFGWEFSDNYFDLVPGMVKKVEVRRNGETAHGRLAIKGEYSKEKININI